MGLDAFADLIASRLLAVGGQAVLLAALVWALCRFLPRLDARTRAWLWWLVAFLLFRLFDIRKPFPIRQFDAKLKNGFGVMWDDIVAAFYTLLVIALWVRVLG